MLTGMLFTMGLAVLAQGSAPSDAKLVDLKDGHVRVETSAYSVEVPKGWSVTRETPWGARKAYPGGGGELGVMTAPPSAQSWDDLIRVSHYYILREEGGKPTPHKIVKTKAGLEAATFSVLDANGFASRRYVLVKDPKRGLLALSVKIPPTDSVDAWEKHFQRLVDTARFKD
ncbi:MAG: hypothetical protein M9921_08530 [Fimbriimonadaceae bacterium]|nr:hypothetical protein [Chthonomonadaceae bacterium]MCO5296889.1 hypothetical protein [Fimbriimonadaceae bacterium]